MIDYVTYCKIAHMHQQRDLKPSQIAATLSIDERTVQYWINEGSYHPRKRQLRSSKLDPYKPQIVQSLEKYSYTSEQMFRMIVENGYDGGRSILKDYIQKIRPRRTAPFLTLSFAPGECAQVDWGHYGVGTGRFDPPQAGFFRDGAVLQPYDVC